MLASRFAVSGWSVFFAALGVAIFLEGLPYFVAPRGARRYLTQLAQLPDGSLRLLGFALMALGLGVAFVSLH